jgi:hypothetical protein
VTDSDKASIARVEATDSDKPTLGRWQWQTHCGGGDSDKPIIVEVTDNDKPTMRVWMWQTYGGSDWQWLTHYAMLQVTDNNDKPSTPV